MTNATGYDRHRRNQVQEYLVWRVYDGELDWFRLQAGKYVPLAANEAGILCSIAFPGLWLDRSALLAGDLTTVLTILLQGLATPAHQTLVECLSTASE
ncbi:MAG: hypothetical protein ACFB12_16465 [Leptolyngbyaceae cyanobacterium]